MHNDLDHIEYEPLRNVFRALDEQTDEVDPQDLQEDLRARGFDPDALAARAKAIVEAGLRERRLSWRTAAKQRLAQFRASSTNFKSWVGRSAAEIDGAVAAVTRGDWGTPAHPAFRERTDLTFQDKAKILDDLERLRRLDENTGPESEL